MIVLENPKLYSLREVAKEMGIHNEQVRRIEVSALAKLKRWFDDNGITYQDANFREGM